MQSIGFAKLVRPVDNRLRPPSSAKRAATFVRGTHEGFLNGIAAGGRRGFKLGLIGAVGVFFASVLPPLAALVDLLGLPSVGTGFEAIAAAILLYGFGGTLIGLLFGGLYGLATGGSTAVVALEREAREAARVKAIGKEPETTAIDEPLSFGLIDRP